MNGLIKLTKPQAKAMAFLYFNRFDESIVGDYHLFSTEGGLYRNIWIEGFNFRFHLREDQENIDMRKNVYLGNRNGGDETDEQLAKRFSTWLLMKKLTI